MTLKNTKSELDSVFKSLEVYASARQFIIIENKNIVKSCRESITATHSANAAMPGNQDDMLKKAQEKSEKAGQILKNLQKRLKNEKFIDTNYAYIIFGKSKAFSEKYSIISDELDKTFFKINQINN